jgi:hypothetical protein
VNKEVRTVSGILAVFLGTHAGALPAGVARLDRWADAPIVERPFQNASQAKTWSAPPSAAEIESRAEKLVANQHHNDTALEQYERIEHHVSRTGGDNPRVLEDRTFRVVPTGSGTMKLLLKTEARAVDPGEYRRQLQSWAELLRVMLKPDDPRTKSAYAKWQKKQQDRAELVDASREAFLIAWTGREERNGRDCDVLDLQPSSSFHPRTIFQEAITHVVAKIWVDRDSNQMVRAEAHLLRDVSFGGGILGKLYRGGVFSLEQAEVSPGLWLPSRYQYDFTGRKFLFTFEEHQYIEASQYHRDGPPKQALAIAESELATGKMAYGSQ